MIFIISVVGSCLADRLATTSMQAAAFVKFYLKSQSEEAWGVPVELRWGALACWTLQDAARPTRLGLKPSRLAAALAKPLQMQMQMQALALHLLWCSVLDLMKHSLM